MYDAPKTIDWFVTSQCNLKCTFCYGPYPEMEKVSLALDIAKCIIKSNSMNVTLCGGEPFVHKDIIDITNFLYQHKKNVFFSTNGHFPKKIEQVLDISSGISISLDGADEITMESMRGKLVSYTKVIESIRLVSENCSEKLKITTVVSKKNINHLDDIAEIVCSFKPNIWRLLHFTSRMRGSLYEKEYLIPKELFYQKVNDLKKNFRI